jgi:septum formation protein
MTTSRKTHWILASASPRRREILAGLGLEFAADPSSLPEPAIRPGESPGAYAVRAARLKARDVAARHRSGLVIGADTIVVCGNTILGKPATRQAAARMLRTLSGRWHRVVTGLSIYDLRSGRFSSGYSESRVHLRRMSPAEIGWYLDTGEYADKAGAYGIQGYAALFIDRVEGCYLNIVGFPVATFESLCRRLGHSLITQLPASRPAARSASRDARRATTPI